MSNYIYLTREGYEKLRKELEYLKTVRRKEITQALEKARSFGDISENAEYDAAKEAQALNEKRIAEIEEKLSRAVIIEEEDISKDEIRIGATVKLQDIIDGEEVQYTLVAGVEANPSQGKISVDSPFARALLGHKKGDIVEINVPAGKLKYRILEIVYNF